MKVNEVTSTEEIITTSQLRLQGGPVKRTPDNACYEAYKPGFVCTLLSGHVGIHEAWGSGLCAVWGQL